MYVTVRVHVPDRTPGCVEEEHLPPHTQARSHREDAASAQTTDTVLRKNRTHADTRTHEAKEGPGRAEPPLRRCGRAERREDEEKLPKQTGRRRGSITVLSVGWV